MVANLVLLVALVAWHDNASDLYGYTGTVATLTVLIAYGMMNIASLIRFTKSDLQAGRWYLLAPPVIGIGLAAYALFANIYPVPAFPFNYFPYIVVVYMAAGGVVLVTSRRRVSDVDMAQYEYGAGSDVVETS
jgi:amino acid transporter